MLSEEEAAVVNEEDSRTVKGVELSSISVESFNDCSPSELLSSSVSSVSSSLYVSSNCWVSRFALLDIISVNWDLRLRADALDGSISRTKEETRYRIMAHNEKIIPDKN